MLGLLDRALVTFLPAVPRPIVRRVADRYIAGTSLPDAVRVVRELNESGRMATIDVLGEEIAAAGEAKAIARTYREVLAAIDHERLDSNISVKLSALGLKLDLDLCRANLEAVVREAEDRSSFVRIDMEDSSCTDDTLGLYRLLREAGHVNVGIVLQAELRRTVADVNALADLQPNVRLCKGIYVEPEAIAFRDHEAVRENYLAALNALLRAGAYVAVATHDEWLIGESLKRIRRRKLPPEGYELQFLLGVRAGRGRELARAGHRLRVYVPYGERWYEYSLRRMRENPRLAGQIAGDTISRIVLLGGRPAR